MNRLVAVTEIHEISAGSLSLILKSPNRATRLKIFSSDGRLLMDAPPMDDVPMEYLFRHASDWLPTQVRVEWHF